MSWNRRKKSEIKIIRIHILGSDIITGKERFKAGKRHLTKQHEHFCMHNLESIMNTNDKIEH